MGRVDARSHALGLFLMLLLVAIYAPASVSGQAQAIEPCPATPAPKIGATAPAKIGAKTSQTLVDATIPSDASLETIVNPYSVKVRELSVIIGSLEGELTRSGVGASSMGNFVTDAMMSHARAKGEPAVLAVTNAGGLRKNAFTAGELRVSDIFELLPFENELVVVDLTGAQVRKLLTNLTRGRDAQSGARVQFRWDAENRPEFISAKLLTDDGREQDIDLNATYRIVTIDYLIKRAGGNLTILLEGTNVTPLNITIRDAVIELVKAEHKAGRKIKPKLDNRFVQVGPGSENPPND